jgi:hypothetical protein
LVRFSVNPKKMLIAVGTTVADVALGVPAATGTKFALEAYGAVSARSDASPLEHEARQLIEVGFLTAATRTLRNESITAKLAQEAQAEIEFTVGAARDEIEINLAEGLREDYLIIALQPLLAEFGSWLEQAGVPSGTRDRMGRYLKEELSIAIQSELRLRTTNYQHLLDSLAASYADAPATRARAWQSYRASLVEMVRAPLFSLNPSKPSVSLEEVYIPLRATTLDTVTKDQSAEDAVGGSFNNLQRKICWLEEFLDNWLKIAESDDPIKIITGEPGAGKSTSAKMYAARLAREGQRVIYIPLHRVDFRGDARRAIKAFCEQRDVLAHDPLEFLSADSPTVLILDGLDELAKLDDVTGDAVRGFVENWDRQIRILNAGQSKIFSIIAGRPLAAARATYDFREPGQKLEVVRYSPIPSSGSEIAKLDQRDQWWRKYGLITGAQYDGLPAAFQGRGRQVDEITAQPLLNYLLAQVADEVEQVGDLSNVHDLYRIIFEEVRKTPHRDRGRPREAVDRLNRPDYDICLEEVAVLAWKTGDRSVGITALENHFRGDENLRGLMDVFEDIREGLYAILDTFYVSPDASGPRSFEFTHKSFREYLTSRRIVRLFSELADEYSHNPRRFKARNALRECLSLFGDTEVDDDLALFLGSEFGRSYWGGDPTQMVACLVALVQESLRYGVPVDGTSDSGFRALEIRSRNVELGLVYCLAACARVVQRPIAIDWPSKTSAQALLIRLTTPRVGSSLDDHRGIPFDWIDFSGQILVSLALQNCSFANCKFEGSILNGVNFVAADLANASFRSANLDRANLRSAMLTGIDLERATLRGLVVWDKDIRAASLSKTTFTKAGAVVENWNDFPRRTARTQKAKTPSLPLKAERPAGAQRTKKR